MSRADRLVHVGGYAGIAAVLASANWAGILGSLLGAVFVLAALAYAGYVGLDALAAWLRASVGDDDPAAAARDAVATDGGHDDAVVAGEHEYRQDLARRGARLWLENDDLTQQQVATGLSDADVAVSRASVSRAVNQVDAAEERGSA